MRITEARLVLTKSADYLKRFTVEIDLNPCKDNDVKEIIQKLEIAKEDTTMNNWINDLINIIKNGKN